MPRVVAERRRRGASARSGDQPNGSLAISRSLYALLTPDVGIDEYHVSRRLCFEGSSATAKGNVLSLQCVLSSPVLRQKLVFGLIAEAFPPTQLWPQKLMEFIDKAASQSAALPKLALAMKALSDLPTPRNTKTVPCPPRLLGSTLDSFMEARTSTREGACDHSETSLRGHVGALQTLLTKLLEVADGESRRFVRRTSRSFVRCGAGSHWAV